MELKSTYQRDIYFNRYRAAHQILWGFLSHFLSHTFGAVQVGLYQLIFPIYALGYSATCAGIQTILSRSVASRLVPGAEKKEARQLLYTGTSHHVVRLTAVLQFFCKNSRHFWLALYLATEDGGTSSDPAFLRFSFQLLYIAVLPDTASA